jgi:hypothetical protein
MVIANQIIEDEPRRGEMIIANQIIEDEPRRGEIIITMNNYFTPSGFRV